MTSGQEKRDYVYINDIVEIIYLLEKTNFNIDVLNIVKGSSNSINDIIGKIDRIFSKKIKFKKIQTKKNFNLNFNNYRLKKYLRDFQFVGLEEYEKNIHNNFCRISFICYTKFSLFFKYPHTLKKIFTT